MSGIWSAKPTFWLPAEGLAEKAQHDRVDLRLMGRAQGSSRTAPGASISYEYVARLPVARSLRQASCGQDRVSTAGTFSISSRGFSRPAFRRAAITEKFVEFGQGTQSMCPALRELES